MFYPEYRNYSPLPKTSRRWWIMGIAKIEIDTVKGRVTKVEGGKPTNENPTPKDTEVNVEQATTLASGCPAWIWIAGKKYQI